MSNELLATVGASLSNIGASIAESVRQADQGGAPSVQAFEACLGAELQRLRAVGEDGIAGALEALRAPLSRIMSVGW